MLLIKCSFIALINIKYSSAGKKVFLLNNSFLFITSFNTSAEITIISNAITAEKIGPPILKAHWNKGEAFEKSTTAGLSNAGSQKRKPIIGNKTKPVKLSDL